MTGSFSRTTCFADPAWCSRTSSIHARTFLAKTNTKPLSFAKEATLGANCTIVCGVEIGRYAFVAAGAVVTHDVPDFALIMGVPGRRAGWMCKCGVRLEVPGSLFRSDAQSTGQTTELRNASEKGTGNTSVRRAAQNTRSMARKCESSDMKSFARRFNPFSLSIKHISVDILLMTVSLYVSLFMRTGTAQLDQHLGALVHFAPLFLIIRLTCFVAFGVYQCMWRYVSIPDATRIAQATGFSMLLMIACTYIFRDFGTLPRSFFFIDAFVCTAAVMSARLLRRRLYEMRDTRPEGSALSRVLIYGAGSTGRMFAQSLIGQSNLKVIGYVDDDSAKLDKVIHGIRVIGNGEDLENLLIAIQPTDLVVAIHGPSAELMRKLVLLGRKHKVRPQILSEIEAKGFQPKSKTMYREVELKDLLNRPSTAIEVDTVRSMLQGKCVLITGAGGSIGAELSRPGRKISSRRSCCYSITRNSISMKSTRNCGRPPIPTA